MPKILVVEDNPQNMKLARFLLEDSGHTVIEARDAEEALSALALEEPDVVLLDIGLPAMDGLRLARLLRSDPRTSALPLIAVTALAMKGDRERAMAAGFDEYLTKPIDIASLREAVDRALRLVRSA